MVIEALSSQGNPECLGRGCANVFSVPSSAIIVGSKFCFTRVRNTEVLLQRGGPSASFEMGLLKETGQAYALS